MHLNDLYLAHQEALVRCTRSPENGPKIAVIGGGTGLSTLLRGLKIFTHHLTAVVSVADNGGSSGLLRKDLGILPPGDIRNCILALADAEPLMNDLINYRFKEGSLDGQNFGNLFLAALCEICEGNFYEAIRNFSHVLAVTGRVLPVSLTSLNITAVLDNQTKIVGESAIGTRPLPQKSAINHIFMVPQSAPVFYESIEAIREADLVVLGPGSLYTSIIPNLLFDEMVTAIAETKAQVVYVCNLMTQLEETHDYTATDHLRAILKHVNRQSCEGFIDYCVVNNAPVPPQCLAQYMELEAKTVSCNPSHMKELGVQLIQAPLVSVNDGTVRHDHIALAQLLTMLASQSIESQIEHARTRVYKNSKGNRLS